jgi:uncharacterized protein
MSGGYFETEGRQVVLRALTGSHNYNLNTPESDEDWKVFVMPTFHDLYHGHSYAHSYTSEQFDYTVHDVRRLGELLWKANPNFVEVLYASEHSVTSSLWFLWEQRTRWATMNLPAFGNACFGMHRQKMGELFKGTSTTKELVDKFGYDTKQACHAMRLLYLMRKMATHYGTPTTGTLFWFREGDAERSFLLDLKAGEVSLDRFYLMVDNWKRCYMDDVNAFYKQREPDYDAWAELQGLMYHFVKDDMER